MLCTKKHIIQLNQGKICQPISLRQNLYNNILYIYKIQGGKGFLYNCQITQVVRLTNYFSIIEFKWQVFFFVLK